MTRNTLENILSESTYMYFRLVGSFLSSSVLFFKQNVLDAEQGIQNYKFCWARQRRSLSPAERESRFENINSLALHCTDKTFAEKSRYSWFILLFCPVKKNNYVYNLIKCELSFLRRSCFVLCVCEPNNFNFPSREYLLREALFRLLPLSSLLEFTCTVFSDFNLS